MSKKKKGLFPCPVCGTPMFEKEGYHEICDVCLWQDDGHWQDDFDNDVTANNMSVNQARENWKKHGKIFVR